MISTADAPSDAATVPALFRALGPLDVRIAIGHARDVSVTVCGPIDANGATTVVEIVGALVAAGSVHVIVDLDSADAHPDLGVSLMLRPLESALRSRGGWLMVAGDGGTASPSARDVDLQDAFSAYRDVIGAGAPAGGAAR